MIAGQWLSPGGKAFMAGADIKDLAEIINNSSHHSYIQKNYIVRSIA